MKTVGLNLQTSPNYDIGVPSTATVTILDDDQTITITTTDDTAIEATTNNGVFTLMREGAVSDPITVNLHISGTATNASDYVTLPNNITFAANVISQTLLVTPLDDAALEDPETVIVQIITGTNYTIGIPDTATVTIQDNDYQTLSVAANSDAAEPDQVGNFTITRNGNNGLPLSVTYALTGTAINGTDYITLSNNIIFTSAQTTADILVTPLDDTLLENNETIQLTLLDSTDYDLLAPISATLTLQDNEQEVTISPMIDTVVEDSSSDYASFLVSRIGATSAPLTVTVAFSGTAVNGTDTLTLTNIVTFPAGVTGTVLRVYPQADAVVEADETIITIIQANPAYLLGSTISATVTILNDDQSLSLDTLVDSIHENETNPPPTFIITRQGKIDDAITVTLSIAGTALNGTDYLTLTNPLIIAANVPTTTITITPIDDTTVETNENVHLTLQPSPDYTLDKTSASITILEDEASVSVSATRDTAEKNAPPGLFTFSRLGDISQPLTLTWVLTGTALNGSDYLTTTTSLVLAANVPSQTLTITPIDDNLDEGAEMVTLQLIDSPAYGLINNSASLTIVDNDRTRVSLFTLDDSAHEDTGDTATFIITRSALSNIGLPVTLQISGTATNGDDYNQIFPLAIIPAMMTSTIITITPLDDDLFEGPETVQLIIFTGSTYDLEPNGNKATVTIYENEQGVSVSAPDALAAEPGSDTGTFLLSRQGGTSQPLTVTYSLTGTAVNGTDYLTLAGEAIIPVGQSSYTLTLTPIDDTLAEGDEIIRLVLEESVDYQLGTEFAANITLVDDEEEVDIYVDDAWLLESGNTVALVTISRRQPPNQPLDVSLTISGTAVNGSDYQNISPTTPFPLGNRASPSPSPPSTIASVKALKAFALVSMPVPTTV